MSLKNELKKYALDTLDMDYVGVTSVDRLAGAPEGYRPTDFLPDARSVIVMAVKLSLGAVQAIFRAHEDGLRHMLSIYGTHGYTLLPNYHLKYASYSMARFLEKRGYMSTPLPSGPLGGGSPFSHRHAAVAAGIGEFGWMSIVLTPDYGPRVRLVSVITRAAIEPDPMYAGPPLCDPRKCGVCVSVCPSHAISRTKAKTVIIGDREYRYGNVEFDTCRIGSEGLTKKTLGLKDIPVPAHPSPEDIIAARQQIDPRQRGEAIQGLGTFYCGKCLAYCPAGPKDWPGTVSRLKIKPKV